MVLLLQGEGVPYYMLRELAVLKGVRHPHIAALEMISLAKDELHVFFPFVDRTLHEIINPTGDPTGGRVLPERVVRSHRYDLLGHTKKNSQLFVLFLTQIRRLLHQLLDAIAYCHRRGVLHRNLKPKHLLIQTSDPAALGEVLASFFTVEKAFLLLTYWCQTMRSYRYRTLRSCELRESPAARTRWRS